MSKKLVALIIKIFKFGLLFLLTLAIVYIGWEWRKYDINPLPNPTVTLSSPVILAPVSIRAKQGEKICPFYENAFRREELRSLSDFSPYIILALIASEDNRFYWHFGFDPFAIVSAISSGRGASTITQQLARTLYADQVGFTAEQEVSNILDLRELNASKSLTDSEMKELENLEETINAIPRILNLRDLKKSKNLTASQMKELENLEKIINKHFDKTINKQAVSLNALSDLPNLRKNLSVKRKISEIFAALKLEFYLSKDDILLAYLNSIDLGGVGNYGGNRGFEAASQYYFGKSATLLNIAEAATLVSMLPAPNQREVREFRSKKYIRETEDFKEDFRNPLINRMYDKGLITNDERVIAEESLLRDYVLDYNDEESLKNTDYCLHIVNNELPEILEKVGKIDKKLIVETSLDLEMQFKAETALNQTLANEGVAKGFDYGGIVTINTDNGDVLAFVGNVSPNYRQPASTFKLFTYLAALEKGKTPKDAVDCSTVQLSEGRIFTCNGSDNATMSEAVAQSFNAPVIHLADFVGIKNVVEMAERLGVSLNLKDKEEPPIGVAIGEESASLLDMTSAYATIANEGKFNEASLVTKVINAKQCTNKDDLNTCPAMYTKKSSSKNVISSDVASSMNKMLQQVVSKGTGKEASLGLGEEAGKTGTQDKNSDLWFIGYIPSKKRITGIWLGNNDSIKATNGTSKDAAALWRRYMKEVIN